MSRGRHRKHTRPKDSRTKQRRSSHIPPQCWRRRCSILQGDDMKWFSRTQHFCLTNRLYSGRVRHAQRGMAYAHAIILAGTNGGSASKGASCSSAMTGSHCRPVVVDVAKDQFRRIPATHRNATAVQILRSFARIQSAIRHLDFNVDGARISPERRPHSCWRLPMIGRHLLLASTAIAKRTVVAERKARQGASPATRITLWQLARCGWPWTGTPP